MTAPLTPADCDLQDFPFMPLHVARLRDSDLAAECEPEACWYAVVLWAASWHQLPAASLPANDAVLARLVGLGRDMKTWKKHKEQALRGFVLCDDGRLYHPVVAEQANAAWTEKLAYRERRARREEIAKKAAQARWGGEKDDASDPAPAMHEAMHDAPIADASCIADAMPKGTGTGTKIEGEPDGSLSSAEPDDADRREGYPDLFEATYRAYPHVKGRSSKRKSFEAWKRIPVVKRAALPVAVARFAKEGREPNAECGARAMERWLRDGLYADWLADDASPSTAPAWPGPADLRAAIVAAKGEDWTRGYVDRCVWQDVPKRALLSANSVVVDTLRREIGPVLARFDATALLQSPAAA